MDKKALSDSKKIHLGCGSNFIHGWDNIDIVMGDGIIVHDLRESLPYKSEIIGTIFMEHVIEHLDKDHGYKLLSDCFRILRSGGVMRIGWPDLSRLIKAYVLRRRNYKDFVIPFLNDINKTGTWDEILSDCLFSWDHKYAYTKKFMSILLTEVGFVVIREKGFRESDYGIIHDQRNDPATTYLEVIKP